MVMPNFQHLKVIYLSRDPRAQVLSRDEVFHIHKSEFTEECVKVEADVFAFRRLSQLFPGQFYFMRYEDFCQQPLEEALQLWKFIRTDHNATMPEEWQDFLTSHDQTKTVVEGQIKRFQYSTYRNSSTQWYKWREEKNITLEDEVFHIHKSEFTEECVKVEADVFAFRRLSQLFPGQFYFMRYEDFCQHPLEEALQLWKFIRTDHNATMPEEWQDFLTSHDQTKTATIRLTLAHVELLMVMPNFQHLKVIYLSRDPRAQVLSRDEVFHIHKSEFTEECVKVEADVYAFRRLSQLFPGQFYFMRYEDFCQQPLVEALQLWKFIRTEHNATMPEEWQDFLTSHDQTKTAVEGQIKRFQYSTYRNSSTQWYKWREEKNITLESLLNVEEVCSTAMDRLGYIPLMNVENVKNLSLPFIRNYSCDFWNCWTHRF
ncbi:uncharacterized protein LOC108675220 [Hyalella azteca]|uniref:Uncharacterized protein LOC108675220 n=1 Tax=Hyalella azteca TaxID=294128 RepID=A0A8B7NY50_HYAAZ|nr:uncharacterized protein LOC108675220 [Hyalella azteca]